MSLYVVLFCLVVYDIINYPLLFVYFMDGRVGFADIIGYF